jgi:hypothetical protein
VAPFTQDEVRSDRSYLQAFDILVANQCVLEGGAIQVCTNKGGACTSR